MPSTSKKQAHFMAAACNNKEFADKVGMDQKVACEFFDADQKKKLNESFLEYFSIWCINEHFASSIHDLKSHEVESLLKAHDPSIDRVYRTKFLGLKNGSDAHYLVVTHDKDNGQYIVNRASIAHYLGRGHKVISISPTPEHIGDYGDAINYVDKKPLGNL